MNRILIILFSLIMCTPLVCSAETITVAVHDYAPYYNHEAKGFLSDIYTESFKSQGITVEYLVLPIERGVIYFFSNKVDAHSPGNIFFNPEQLKQADCVKTFKIMACWHYYKPLQKRINFTSLDDMRGYRLGIIYKSPYAPLYRSHQLTIFEVQRPAQLVKKVQAGRDNFFEATLFSGLVMINSIFPKEWDLFDYIAWDVSDGSLAFLKNNTKAQRLKKIFEKGFNQVKQNGTYIEILERYWGKNNIPKDILPDDLMPFGTEHFSIKTFQQYKRTEYGEIIQEDTALKGSQSPNNTQFEHVP